MFKTTQAKLDNFSDKEIHYLLQYAKTYLEERDYIPDDGTLQGDILKRLHTVIRGDKK